MGKWRLTEEVGWHGGWQETKGRLTGRLANGRLTGKRLTGMNGRLAGRLTRDKRGTMADKEADGRPRLTGRLMKDEPKTNKKAGGR